MPTLARDVVRTTADVARFSVVTAQFVVALPNRIDALLDQAEVLIARVDEVTEGAAAVVAKADAVSERAATVVTTATSTSDTAQNLLAVYEPMAMNAAPLAQTFVDDLSREEVHAAVRLVDNLPELTERMTALMPILATLDTVSPEIHELLEVVKDVRHAVQGVPGFKFFRRRGEEKDEAE